MIQRSCPKVVFVHTSYSQTGLSRVHILNFRTAPLKSLSQIKRLKKEMTESSSQMKMIDWLCDKYGAEITRNEGEDICIVDICSGKGFFGVLASQSFTESTKLCLTVVMIQHCTRTPVHSKTAY